MWMWSVPWLDQGIALHWGFVVTGRGEKERRGGKANGCWIGRDYLVVVFNIAGYRHHIYCSCFISASAPRTVLYSTEVRVVV